MGGVSARQIHVEQQGGMEGAEDEGVGTDERGKWALGVGEGIGGGGVRGSGWTCRDQSGEVEEVA